MFGNPNETVFLMFDILLKIVLLTISSIASLTPVAAKTQISGTAVASGLNAVILGMDCHGTQY